MDPIIGIGFSQDVNSYNYALNSPLNVTDPSGLCDVVVCPWIDGPGPNPQFPPTYEPPPLAGPDTGEGMARNSWDGALHTGRDEMAGVPSTFESTVGGSWSAWTFYGISSVDAATDAGEAQLAPYISAYDLNDPNYHRYPIGPTTLCTVGELECSFDMVAPIVAANSVPFTWLYAGPGSYNLPYGTPVWLGGDPITHWSPPGGVWLNDTQLGHRYHPGTVGHALYQSGGRLWLYTLGVGVGANSSQNVAVGQRIFGAMHLNVRIEVLDRQLGPPPGDPLRGN